MISYLARALPNAVGDGKTLEIKGRGTAMLESGGQRMQLNKVAYVPEMKFKLVSGIVLDGEGKEYRGKDGEVIP